MKVGVSYLQGWREERRRGGDEPSRKVLKAMSLSARDLYALPSFQRDHRYLSKIGERIWLWLD